MKNLFILIILLAAFTACKTSEANYRAAYEKTIAGQEEGKALENTVYGTQRQLSQTVMINGNDSVPVMMKMVSVLEEAAPVSGAPGKLMIAVGRFKQKFNAVSLRQRLVDDGYDDAFVVQTAEPYYYVVAMSFDKIADAAAALEKVRSNPPVAMKDPLPFILRDPRK